MQSVYPFLSFPFGSDKLLIIFLYHIHKITYSVIVLNKKMNVSQKMELIVQSKEIKQSRHVICAGFFQEEEKGDEVLRTSLFVLDILILLCRMNEIITLNRRQWATVLPSPLI